jgi:exopolyphosphatase/pppGpp-phosphohydrolase
MKGLPQGRADMIVPASLLVKHILNVGNFQGFNVSPFALKEGVLSSLAG